MHNGERNDFKVGYGEGFCGYFGDVECWDTGVRSFGKAIRDTVTEVAGYVRSAINGEAVAHSAIRPEVVDATDMVVVAVSDQECFEHRGALLEHLLPEIGSAVDEDVFTFVVDHCGCSQPFVMFITALASGA